MKLNVTQALKRSHWETSIESITPFPVLTATKETDIAIIGGGFVGLWTAITIKEREPSRQIVLLEQDVCGGGASSRNGGFAMSWWPKVGTIRTFCTEEQTLFLCHSAEKAITELGEFCEKHNIDAHFTQKGWLWTATAPAHIDSWNSTLRACERLGVQPFERLSTESVQRRTGSKVHLAGVIEASNATVQPAALVRGMRRVAKELGVEIYEKSGVNKIEPGTSVQLHTANGKVTAKTVVLANNAWAAAIPELAALITPVNSSIVATNPLGERLEKMGWTGGESITDSQLLVDYYRTTKDARIAFGKGTGAISYGGVINQVFSEHDDSITLTKNDLLNTYPNLNAEDIGETWSGPIDRTYDSLPVFGNLKNQRNIFYGIGWSGNGVGPSRIGGRILASLALGTKDEWSQCALVNREVKKFPPEPFRYVGGKMVRNAVIRKEQAEMKGQKSAYVDRILAKLAPAGLEDKG